MGQCSHTKGIFWNTSVLKIWGVYSIRHGERFGFKAERTPGFRKKSEIVIREAVSACGNEEEIGQAIREAIDEGIVQREDIFVTTNFLAG